jgi:hypothetical protein
VIKAYGGTFIGIVHIVVALFTFETLTDLETKLELIYKT